MLDDEVAVVKIEFADAELRFLPFTSYSPLGWSGIMKFAGLRIFASSGSTAGAEVVQVRLARILPSPPRPPDGTCVFFEERLVSITERWVQGE